MQTITVESSRKYNVIIQRGLLEKSGELISRAVNSSACAVITDDIVDTLYADTLMKSLSDAGFRCVKLVIAHGEKSKNTENYLSILDFLAKSHITRKDAVIALGGGVIGDLAGFAAATYMRGCKLVQIPTTLLAMVDSAVGGKTAIDLPSGKNMCGAFYQPHLVLCDTALLGTLPDDVFSDGCAEVIKYGCIASPSLFEYLEKNGRQFDPQYVIPLCVQIKSGIIASDEFDTGIRMLLNFGHTFAHALEKAADYTVSHGKAVAIGMAVMAECAANAGFCRVSLRNDIITLLEKFGFELHHGFEPDTLFDLIYTDKKSDDDGITVVLPSERGVSRLVRMRFSELKDFIRHGALLWK